MTVAKCKLCPDEETGFRVPWDEVGQALMTEHMGIAHGRRPSPGLCGCVGGPHCCAGRRNESGSCEHADCCVKAFPTAVVAS